MNSRDHNNLQTSGRQSSRRQSSRQSGQIIIMLTMMLVPMFGMLGLVADVGYMHFVKMSAQTAAESAAQATVVNLHKTLGGSDWTCTTPGITCSATPATCAQITTPTNSVEVGCMYAQAHGFKSTNQWVTYQAGIHGTPPTATGSGTGSYWVTFRVIQKVPQMFSAILGNMSGMVAARSSAAIQGASDCIYALNRHAAGAVSVGGNASLTSACGLYVNSDSGSAISVWGNATLQAPEYDVVGNVTTASPLSPPPNLGVAPITDPLATLPVPATATYTCDHFNYSSGVSNWTNPTLSPGVYCGGLSVDHNVYNFNPGNYIFVGGGLTVGANGGVSGTGVMFYNTFGATTTHGTLAFGPINIGANSAVNLKAPTSGTYAGILFFDDRSAPASSANYGGGASAVYEGTIYELNAAVTMRGNSSVGTDYTLLVCDTISMIGDSTFHNDYSMLPSGSPIQRIVVVE